ncbi:MAG: PIN domain-containing protein [Bythopirellula sp.]|nr:PIN domain-containing protein [Bythopirellula sp.]
MSYLLDTGVLLRLVNKEDAQHVNINQAVEILSRRRERLFVTNQNIAEFWNVATRPMTENGWGLSVEIAASSIQTGIEPICTVLREHSNHYSHLKKLLESYSVVGKQVHDARLVASMLTWKIPSILTLNAKHFKRFEPKGIVIATPETVLVDE